MAAAFYIFLCVAFGGLALAGLMGVPCRVEINEGLLGAVRGVHGVRDRTGNRNLFAGDEMKFIAHAPEWFDYWFAGVLTALVVAIVIFLAVTTYSLWKDS
jgi:hypothetical protein